MHWPAPKESPHPLERRRFESQKASPQNRACDFGEVGLRHGLVRQPQILSPPCKYSAASGSSSMQVYSRHTNMQKDMRFLQESGCPSSSHFLTLNSSEISDMKEEICFMSRSMLLSLPVFSSVVMARVAMLRLESVTRFSRSRLQAVTADGCFMATCSSKGRMKIPQQMQKVQLAKNSKTHSFPQK